MLPFFTDTQQSLGRDADLLCVFILSVWSCEDSFPESPDASHDKVELLICLFAFKILD
jgi:hypothetical protein